MAQLSPELRVRTFGTGRQTFIQHPRLSRTLCFSTWGCQFGRTDSKRENASTGLSELQECCRLGQRSQPRLLSPPQPLGFPLLLWGSLSCFRFPLLQGSALAKGWNSDTSISPTKEQQNNTGVVSLKGCKL